MRPLLLLLGLFLLASAAEARQLRLLDRTLAVSGLRTGPALTPWLEQRLVLDDGGGSGSGGPDCAGVAVEWVVSWAGGLIGYFPAFLVAWALGVNTSPTSLGYTISFGIGLALLRPFVSTVIMGMLVNMSYHRKIRFLWTLGADVAVSLAVLIFGARKDAPLNTTSTWFSIFGGAAAGAIVGNWFAEGHAFSSVAPRDDARPAAVALAEPPVAVQVPLLAASF